MTDEIYVSTDVETDGPIPGPHSLLSLGSAAFALEGGRKRLVATFTANLEPLPGAAGAPHTHLALDDAIEQGALFCNMVLENLKGAG